MIVVNNIPSHLITSSATFDQCGSQPWRHLRQQRKGGRCCTMLQAEQRDGKDTKETAFYSEQLNVHPHVFRTLLKGNGRADIVSLAIEQERFGFERFL